MVFAVIQKLSKIWLHTVFMNSLKNQINETFTKFQNALRKTVQFLNCFSWNMCLLYYGMTVYPFYLTR